MIKQLPAKHAWIYFTGGASRVALVINLWLGSRISTNEKRYANRSWMQSKCFSLDLLKGLLHSMARNS
ncbi:hypothetical protein EGJ12_21170 [Stutzerimonas stutzeri]|nr:hypothetical protein DZC76_17500 [Pseudomonas sp. phDV1]RRV31245.1 hypothetical protein EGJ12_21170 [Stutzerimonas stutzeri]